ncbi:MAG: response regulator [bacterium]
MADRKRILIADDDPDLADLLETDLGKQGYEIRVVANGKDALQAVTREQFDLVLLDVMMPYIDGYHVAYEISSGHSENIPKIIIMTSRDTSREKGIALMSGANLVLQKPFTLEELHARIKEALTTPEETQSA